MAKCDKCGYETLKWGDYYKERGEGVCLCEECYDHVDHEYADLFGHTFDCLTVGIDDVDYDEDFEED